MQSPETIAIALLFIPMAAMITYMDIRYRRIPNQLVLLMLIGGLALNTIFDGIHGLQASIGGSAVAFILMIVLHMFGTMGAGDVKLFAAIGAIVGITHVFPTLVVVALTGGVLALIKMIHSGRVVTTMFGVFQVFYGLLPGQRVPRIEVPSDRSHTLPYAVPICFGSLIAFFLFRA